MAFYNDTSLGSGDRRWVRQAVMGVLRWKDLSSGGGSSTRHSIGTTREVRSLTLLYYFKTISREYTREIITCYLKPFK